VEAGGFFGGSPAPRDHAKRAVYRPSLNSVNFELDHIIGRGLYTIMLLEDLSYCECYNCQNYFFIAELPLGINNPQFCPYCGIDFEETIEIETPDDL